MLKCGTCTQWQSIYSAISLRFVYFQQQRLYIVSDDTYRCSNPLWLVI